MNLSHSHTLLDPTLWNHPTNKQIQQIVFIIVFFFLTLLAMRNLLRDLKSNLLDDSAFRRELETILRDENLSAELRDRLEKIAPVNK